MILLLPPATVVVVLTYHISQLVVHSSTTGNIGRPRV